MSITLVSVKGCSSGDEYCTTHRDRELEQLRLRLLNQLDQRTGREKAVLRRTIAALNDRRRSRRDRSVYSR